MRHEARGAPPGPDGRDTAPPEGPLPGAMDPARGDAGEELALAAPSVGDGGGSPVALPTDAPAEAGGFRRWIGRIPPGTLYYVSYLAVPVFGLLQTRLLTLLLSPAEYGTVQLALPILAWTGTIAGLGLPAFLLRFYPRDGAVVFHESLALTVLMLPVAALAGVGILAASTGGAVPVELSTAIGFTLALAALLAYLLAKAMLRALERHIAYNALVMLDRALGLLFITGGVALLPTRPVDGYLAGTFLVYAGAMVLVIRLGGRPLPVGFRLPGRGRMRELLLYGLPTVAVILVADLYLNATRYLIVNAGLGADTVAKFALSYTVTNLGFQSLYEPLLTYMYPQVFKAYEERRLDRVALGVSRCLRYYLILGVVVVAGFAAFGQLAVRLVAGQAYWIGTTPFALLVAASYVFGLYRILATHYYMRHTTVELALCFGAGLVVSLGTAALLLGRSGLTGVAQGILAGAIFLTLITWWRGRGILQLNPVHLPRVHPADGA